jgi:hypothetical protein
MTTMPKAEPVDVPASAAWDTDLVAVYRVDYGRRPIGGVATGTRYSAMQKEPSPRRGGATWHSGFWTATIGGAGSMNARTGARTTA